MPGQARDADVQRAGLASDLDPLDRGQLLHLLSELKQARDEVGYNLFLVSKHGGLTGEQAVQASTLLSRVASMRPEVTLDDESLRELWTEIAEASRRLGKDAEGLAALLQWQPEAGTRSDNEFVEDVASTPAPGRPDLAGERSPDADEFIEDVVPAPGLPDLVREYSIPPLESGLPIGGTVEDAQPRSEARHAAAVQRARSSAAGALVAVNKRLGAETDSEVFAAAGIEPEGRGATKPGLLRRLTRAVRGQ